MSQTREINLVPYDEMMRDKARRRIWMWVGIIQLVIIVLWGAYALEKRKIGAVEGEIADLSLKKLEIEEKIKQLNILRDKRDRLAKKKRAINPLLHKRSLSSLFSELEKVMNKNVWLTFLDYKDNFSFKRTQGEDSDEWVETGYFIVKKNRSETQKVSQNKATGVSTVLQGIAKSNRDLADFLEQLSKSKYFSEVNLKYSQQGIYEGINVVEFEIETYCDSVQKI